MLDVLQGAGFAGAVPGLLFGSCGESGLISRTTFRCRLLFGYRRPPRSLACGARAGLRKTGLADCHAFETHTKVLA